MERLLIYFQSTRRNLARLDALEQSYVPLNLLRLGDIEADAIFSHQLNRPRSSAPVDTGQGLVDNRSLQNPVNHERVLSDWSMQGFVVWN